MASGSCVTLVSFRRGNRGRDPSPPAWFNAGRLQLHRRLQQLPPAAVETGVVDRAAPAAVAVVAGQAPPAHAAVPSVPQQRWRLATNCSLGSAPLWWNACDSQARSLTTSPTPGISRASA